MKMDHVFHVLLLELEADDPYSGEIQSPPPQVVVDEEGEYKEVEILNSSI